MKTIKPVVMAKVILAFPVTGTDRGLNISAYVEVTFDLYAERVAGLHKVFEHQVNDVLMKNLHLAKRIDVELKTLQLDATLVRRVGQADRGKVRKIREGTDAGEFRDVELDLDLAPGKVIREGVERMEIHLRARRRLDVESLLVRWC